MAREHYYLVGLSIPATWQEHTYTYASEKSLALGQIVVVPFGRAQKLGYVIKEVNKKPSFHVKSVAGVVPHVLPKQTQELLHWLYDYYPTAPGVHVQHVLPAFLKKVNEAEQVEATKPHHPTGHSLTKQQAKIVADIGKTDRPVVLHGITGSGKTRVYAELIKQQLAAGKNALVLYPEISLTSQLLGELSRALDSTHIHAYHSKQTPRQQRDSWQKAVSNEGGNVFIGPRSALFLPHQNLGVIIVDEVHDGAYKQDSGTRYHGLPVAAALARAHKAQLVLASATPPVQETYQITSKGGMLLTMDTLAKESDARRQFDLIDMTDKTNRSASPLLSKQLITRMTEALKNNKQILLFLNRRGTARMLLCENCGWHATCSRCDSQLTYHHDAFKVQCHLCGLQQKAPASCPECSHQLTQKTPGVKAIEQELHQLFPDASIGRFDSDNKKSESVSEQYQAIKDGDIDILIGTQLITKGLDLPHLEVVGVLQADGAMLLPDYVSEERAFQQLVQVSGRVGRGHNDTGHVVIQTYQPNNSLFSYVINQDWPGFYTQEVEKRQMAGFPPFQYAMKLWASKSSRTAAENAMKKLQKTLSTHRGVRILGPAPSFYEKTAGKYSWQTVVLSPSRKQLAAVATELPKDILFDLDPSSLL